MIEIIVIMCSIFGYNSGEKLIANIEISEAYEYPKEQTYQDNTYILTPTPWKKLKKDKI